jgi:hypothetical protein
VTVALPLVVIGDAPAATLELRRGTETLAAVALPVETPQAGGRLVIVGRQSLTDLSQGQYELRVTVTQGGQTVTRTAKLTLVP